MSIVVTALVVVLLASIRSAVVAAVVVLVRHVWLMREKLLVCWCVGWRRVADEILLDIPEDGRVVECFLGDDGRRKR